MPRSITFNGQTLFKPGGISRVNASALSPIGISATGVMSLIGESDKGAPGAISGPINVDDPALAAELFGSGPLADAIRIAFDPSVDQRIPGGAFRCVCYKTNHSTQSGTHLPGAGALVTDTVASATTTAITLVTGGLIASAQIGRWLKSGTELRQIVANTASIVTVAPGFSVAPAGAATVTIQRDEILLTSIDYGEETTQVAVEFEPGIGTSTSVVTLTDGAVVNQSPDLGGSPFLIMQYAGGAIPANGSGAVTVATPSVITMTVGSAPTLNAFAGMLLQFADGKQRLIASNTAASPTAITLTGGYFLTTVEAAAVVGTTVQVRNVTSATVTIAGASGAATTMTSVVAPVADNLNITFGAGMTLRQLVAYLNGSTNYVASIPNGVNPDTTLMASFDFGTRATTVDVRFDQEITPDTKGNFRRDLQVAIDWINNFSTIATAVRASAGTSEGGEIPSYTGGAASIVDDNPIYFVGGVRGTSANSDFQAGFDALLEVRVNQIVPLISQDLTNEGFGSTATFASVAAQLSAHVTTCAGIGKSERGGYLGMHGTKTQLINQASSLNNTDVILFGQQPTVLDVTGTLVVQDEWAMAVIAAGMRCGAPEVGEPLTFKAINVQGLTQDTSWSPRSITDVNALIQAGVMFAEAPPKGGFRMVRDETTYLIDDNVAYLDGNTRDAVRFVAYDLRTDLEDQFTGLKAKPATVANIRERVVAKMGEYLADNIIVASLDPETGTKVISAGYRNLRVTITGNVATIKVEIFITTGIIFELTDIYLQLPRLAA